MYPTTIAFPDELRETYLPLLLHLPYEVEQATVVRLVACDDVSSAAQEVVAVLCSTYKCIKLLAAIARGDHDGLTPRLAYRIEQLVYQYMQQMVCTLARAIVNALAQRRGAGGEFGNGKI